MTETIMSVEDLEADADAVLATVEAGETIVLTRGGEPVAVLKPLPRYPERGFGLPGEP